MRFNIPQHPAATVEIHYTWLRSLTGCAVEAQFGATWHRDVLLGSSFRPGAKKIGEICEDLSAFVGREVFIFW